MSNLKESIETIKSQAQYNEQCQEYLEILSKYGIAVHKTIDNLENLCLSLVSFLDKVDYETVKDDRKATVDKVNKVLDTLNRFIEQVRGIDL